MGPEILWKYFPELDNSQKEKLSDIQPILQDWNSKINVISRKDTDELYMRHVLHSLAIAKFMQFPASAQVLDVGTGGGFPGIPLAILFPEVEFTLVDSIGKKIQVVQDTANQLELSNVVAQQTRAEQVKQQFDFVVTRAVASAKQLWLWTHQRLRQPREDLDTGILCLKGGDLTAELKELRRPYQQVEIGDYFEEDFFETKKIIFIPR